MSRKNWNLAHCVALMACGFLIATSAAAADGKDGKGDGRASTQLVVSAATVVPGGNGSGPVLFLAGENFGDHPAVFFAGEPLSVLHVSPDGTILGARLEPGLEPGSYLVVVSRGPATTQNGTFVVSIGGRGPKGDPGPAGPAGPRGENGARGEVGAQGTVGPQGPIGPRGADGLRGLTGTQGPAGPQGPQGPAGPQGPQGTQGPIGLTGATGSIGPQGPAGPAGPPGSGGTVTMLSASGRGLPVIGGDWKLLAMLSEPLTIQVSSNTQKVLVTSHKALGSSFGDATDLNLWICRQDSAGALIKVGPGVMRLSLPNPGMQLYSLSAVLENLAAGTYQVGLCGSSIDVDWDLDEFSTTTALVTN